MRLVARAIPVLFGLVVAAAAFVHASSEALPGLLGTTSSFRSSLNGHELTTLADQGFRVEMNSRQSRDGQIPRLSDELTELARDSFAVDPLEVSTLRTIALGSVLQEDEDRARQLMRNAARVSKRDDVANLWLAQDYGRTGDVEAMALSFDHALRTSVRARKVAMAPVVNMLADEESYAPLGQLLARAPEWEGDFWREFVRNPVAVVHSARFLAGSSIPISRVPPDERKVLYSNLMQAGQFETLYSLATLDPDAKASADELAAGRFATAEEGNPLGWTMRPRGNYAAGVHRETGNLEIDARAGSFGVAAERIVHMDADYQLTIAMAEPVPENATIDVYAMCAGAESATARITLTAGQDGGETVLRTGACEFATLQVAFSVEPGRRDALLRIGSVTLRPT